MICRAGQEITILASLPLVSATSSNVPEIFLKGNWCSANIIEKLHNINILWKSVSCVNNQLVHLAGIETRKQEDSIAFDQVKNENQSRRPLHSFLKSKTKPRYSLHCKSKNLDGEEQAEGGGQSGLHGSTNTFYGSFYFSSLPPSEQFQLVFVSSSTSVAQRLSEVWRAGQVREMYLLFSSFQMCFLNSDLQ